ncbi:FdhB3 [Desulforapulum autotrophicum HRM2]|uniref:FdhB3 n=1 Tax=Desulforapulum autotrophicum (strain ATCC 43914 / DSM 3382 / VKM B-1955 / HRM2) TaxID=177437 RepID=C0QLZ3_DESAH|nr:protein FdhB3 [Desulforapulum autotrophicum]ACN14299.1 FdhB3 [Desulforapulum autotrophicum HRM2]
MDITGQVERLLKQKTVDIFLGYRDFCGHLIPHGYTLDNLEDLDNLKTSSVRYSLEKVATHLAEKNPDLKIGLIARDCTERALNVLYTWNQLKSEKIETIDVNCCPSRTREHADCSLLEPKKTGNFKQKNGIDFNADPQDFMAENDNGERFSRWMYEFSKCIKCYGCRNICPVCFCPDCSLENPDLVEPGFLPPEIPIFHLVRAVHMAGRCVDCGLCEDACPAEIPLRFLYRQMNDIVEQVFGYIPGKSIEKSPFTIIGDKVTLEPKPMDA